MIRWPLVILAIAVTVASAGSIAYFVSPQPRVEAEQRSAAPSRDVTGSAAAKPVGTSEDRIAEDFLKAAEAILRPLSSAEASARSDELPILGQIPLPKRRPIPR